MAELDITALSSILGCDAFEQERFAARVVAMAADGSAAFSKADISKVVSIQGGQLRVDGKEQFVMIGTNEECVQQTPKS